MNEEIKKALENLCDLANCGDLTFSAKHNVFTRLQGVEKYKPILENALNQAEENEQQNKILKQELNEVNDFRTHYKFYQEKLANNLKTINCMQEVTKTNHDLIWQLKDRNNMLVERLEKQKVELIKLREERQLLDSLQMFKKFVCQGVLCAIEQNHTYLQLRLTPELKEWCENEMNKKGG